MLGKLISYEFRGIWKPALVIVIIMAVAGIAGAMAFSTMIALADAPSYGAADGAVTSLVVVLMLFTVFAGFLVWAGVVALFIMVVARFYRTMFTDQGYLTLTLPVSSASLVLAKYLVAFIVMTVGAVLAIVLYALLLDPITSEYELSGSTAILMMLSGNLNIWDAGESVAALAGALNMLVGIAYQLGLAFLALTLGAWWAKRHKVAAAVGVFIGVGWLISLVFSVANVLVLTTTGYSWDMVSVMSGAVTMVQMVCNIAIAVAAVALSIFLVRRKVDLS